MDKIELTRIRWEAEKERGKSYLSLSEELANEFFKKVAEKDKRIEELEFKRNWSSLLVKALAEKIEELGHGESVIDIEQEVRLAAIKKEGCGTCGGSGYDRQACKNESPQDCLSTCCYGCQDAIPCPECGEKEK